MARPSYLARANALYLGVHIALRRRPLSWRRYQELTALAVKLDVILEQAIAQWTLSSTTAG